MSRFVDCTHCLECQYEFLEEEKRYFVTKTKFYGRAGYKFDPYVTCKSCRLKMYTEKHCTRCTVSYRQGVLYHLKKQECSSRFRTTKKALK